MPAKQKRTRGVNARIKQTARTVKRIADKATNQQEIIARKELHDAARDRANQIEEAQMRIREVLLDFSLPQNPFDDLLSECAEFLNQIADEFDDNPDDDEPSQTFAQAADKVRQLHSQYVEKLTRGTAKGHKLLQEEIAVLKKLANSL